jgi:hypothetical protein
MSGQIHFAVVLLELAADRGVGGRVPPVLNLARALEGLVRCAAGPAQEPAGSTTTGSSTGTGHGAVSSSAGGAGAGGGEGGGSAATWCLGLQAFLDMEPWQQVLLLLAGSSEESLADDLAERWACCAACTRLGCAASTGLLPMLLWPWPHPP